MDRNLNYIFLLFFLIAALILGFSVVSYSGVFTLYFLIAVSVIFISFANIKFAIALLVMSMLLSPEIAIAEVPNRAVVIRIDDLLLALVFCVWLAKSALNKELPLLKASPVNRYIFYYIAACILFTGKGFILGDVNPMRAMFYIIKYLEYFMLFWMVYNVIDSKKDVEFFLKVALFTALIVIAYSYTLIHKIPAAPFDDEPGSLGGYYIIVMSVCFGIYIYHPKRILKWLMLGVIILMFPVLIRAQSRATYMAIIPMYITITILTKKYKKRFILTALIILLILISFIADIDFVGLSKGYGRYRDLNAKSSMLSSGGIVRTLQERIKYTFSGNFGSLNLEPSAAARLISWDYMLREKFPKKPLFGWGITALGFIDSQYIRTLVELGLVGLFLFLLMLYKCFFAAIDVYKYDDYLAKALSLGLIASFISLVFHATSTNTFIIVRIMEPFWFLLAIVLSMARLVKPDEN